jgi:group II intron reverse transcriptase/maturase
VSVQEIDRREGGARKWLEELSEQLETKSYRADAVLRVLIPKADGKQRPLGIPTVRDRVVQTAAWLVLMPIYEADFHPQSYGYRPRRNAQQAMEAVKSELWKGRTEIVDADLSAYFDQIDHRLMLKQLAKRISDGSVLGLIRQWLRAPVVEEGPGRARQSRRNQRGTPQGGSISPLLANLYLTDLDYGVNEGTQQKAKMVRYADDLVILCAPGQAEAVQRRLRQWLERRGLRLNEKKTRIVEARKEGFEFLGWRVTPRRTRRGPAYYHMEPSGKSRVKLMSKVREILQHRTRGRDAQEVVAELNAVTRGWSQYFRHGHWREIFRQMDDMVGHRLRTWLWNKQRRSRARYGHYTKTRMREEYGWQQMSETYV